MFNTVDRLQIIVNMIIVTVEERKKFLAELIPLQKTNFKGLLKVMNGKPVTVRLLDLPFHKFLPTLETILR